MTDVQNSLAGCNAVLSGCTTSRKRKAERFFVEIVLTQISRTKYLYHRVHYDLSEWKQHRFLSQLQQLVTQDVLGKFEPAYLICQKCSESLRGIAFTLLIFTNFSAKFHIKCCSPYRTRFKLYSEAFSLFMVLVPHGLQC